MNRRRFLKTLLAGVGATATGLVLKRAPRQLEDESTSTTSTVKTPKATTAGLSRLIDEYTHHRLEDFQTRWNAHLMYGREWRTADPMSVRPEFRLELRALQASPIGQEEVAVLAEPEVRGLKDVSLLSKVKGRSWRGT